jgi:periplasmic protein TonB
MVAATFRGDPWRRVSWLLPTAAALTLVLLVGFLKLLAGEPALVAHLPQVLEVDLVGLAPSATTAWPAPPPSDELPQALESPPESFPAEPRVAQPLPATPAPQDPEPAVVPDTRSPPIARGKPSLPAPRRASLQKSAPAGRAPTPSSPVAGPSVPPSLAPAPSVVSAPPNGGNIGARAIYQPLPTIPEELRRRAIDLVAMARFHVAVDGSAEVELIQPTPDAVLNRALLDALSRWRFFPAIEDGKPHASTIDIRIPIEVR